MKRLILLFAVLSITTPARAQHDDPQWTPTEDYVNQIKQEFNQCMNSYQNSGAPITNGVFLNCLPSGDDVRNVIANQQPITSMEACVDWSLAFMGGIISGEMMNQLSANTSCETEGVEIVSLHHMLGWVITSEIEPYGI